MISASKRNCVITGFYPSLPISQDDELTHLYTLVLKPDNTYVVKIDNKEIGSGKLEEDWDFLPPKTIPDPEAKKPEDWDDKPKIDDPEATKPEVRLSNGKWNSRCMVPSRFVKKSFH